MAKAKEGVLKVSRFLATPTDLAAKDVAAITEALNGLAADSFALYVKTKNFHWHLSGVHFRDLHLLFDEQADAIFVSVDLLAERVRRIGGTTIRSIGHVGQLSRIRDDNDEFVPPHEMVRRLMADNETMIRAQRQAHDVCDEARDFASASIIETLIDEAERRNWFLFEVLQGLETH
ncbi:MAG: DNA starvation/stationary phase protection protein [Candidatus Sericytochromatia bacterium]|nr:DNA starvation/stationary phase protection protein [Candidatus Sericytochromatia bacterium]